MYILQPSSEKKVMYWQVDSAEHRSLHRCKSPQSGPQLPQLVWIRALSSQTAADEDARARCHSATRASINDQDDRQAGGVWGGGRM